MGPEDRERTRAGTGRVQSVERAVALLNAVASGSPAGRPAAELAAECAINRATAWRLLATLEHHGLVDRDPATNRYSVGFAVTRIAMAASVQGLVRRTRPVLERISAETGETANLAVAQRTGLTYVDEVVPPAVLTARWLGRHVPIHATSAGKAFLAWLPEEEVGSILSAPLAGYTRTTHTDEGDLRAELSMIRDRGYGVSAGELESGVHGVAAAALDHNDRPFAIVSLWGPSDRVPPERFAELGAVAVRAADEITRTVRT
ncbi:MAG: IclR family transcriptional regulator [Nocardioidaceae bacterium]